MTAPAMIVTPSNQHLQIQGPSRHDITLDALAGLVASTEVASCPTVFR
jgi:hypothetical protein